MSRYFNTEGCCFPEEHYMVNIESRIAQIKNMVDMGKYFSINRGRQYGKTTTLKQLKKYLADSYTVVSLDFQLISTDNYISTSKFVNAFSKMLTANISVRKSMSERIFNDVYKLTNDEKTSLDDLFYILSEWCGESSKPVILMIDEVDQASDNQVFLDFLAQLRGYYLNRDETSTFKSVIFAGVHDVRNIRQKIRSDMEHKRNSPWNISAEFNVDMSFSSDDIAGMLLEYENDKKTGMDIQKISQLIYDYTSGYPVLVSSICKINDENLSEDIRWTSEGITMAVSRIVSSTQPLFESLVNKLEDSQSLRRCVHDILMNGDSGSYNPDDSASGLAMMYGFIKSDNGSVKIANRIFETRLYNYFLTASDKQITPIYQAGSYDKSQFIRNGILDMDRILEKFILHFNEIMGNQPERFREEKGREYFLLYLRPIINGTGNYYIEAQTRDHRRMDVVVDYFGVRYIIELKIWRGEEYNRKGEEQLCDYLKTHNLKKGYLLSFCFNQNKKTGISTVQIGDITVTEAVV